MDNRPTRKLQMPSATHIMMSHVIGGNLACLMWMCWGMASQSFLKLVFCFLLLMLQLSQNQFGLFGSEASSLRQAKQQWVLRACWWCGWMRFDGFWRIWISRSLPWFHWERRGAATNHGTFASTGLSAKCQRNWELWNVRRCSATKNRNKVSSPVEKMVHVWTRAAPLVWAFLEIWPGILTSDRIMYRCASKTTNWPTRVSLQILTHAREFVYLHICKFKWLYTDKPLLKPMLASISQLEWHKYRHV